MKSQNGAETKWASEKKLGEEKEMMGWLGVLGVEIENDGASLKVSSKHCVWSVHFKLSLQSRNWLRQAQGDKCSYQDAAKIHDTKYAE